MIESLFEPAAKKRGAEFLGDQRLQRHDKPSTAATTGSRPKSKVTSLLLARNWRLAVLICFALCVLKYGSITNSIADSFEAITNTQTSEEIASLMTEFYELLAKMGYYDSALIQRPIHLLGINVTLALELGYSQKAIQVMQMLPYLGIQDENNKYELGWGDEFLLNGGFTDLRTDEALSQCRDPFYLLDEDEEENKLGWDDPGGKYMKPDYICLSELANHGTVMILNVKNYRLWTIDQETGNSDPTVKDNDWTVSKNENSLDNFASRPARDALKSYMQKFISLEWMPPEWPGSYEGDNYARLYIENGWPDNFNLSAFNISRLQWHEDEFRRRRAEEPFEQVQKLESGLNHNSELEVIYLRVIQDVSAGLGLPRTAPTNPDGTVVDRVTYRQGVMKTLDEIREGILALEKKLTAAREVVKLVDPAVAQARKERKVKYGQLS